MGIESGRLHFSWISSAEASKFVEVVKEITEQVVKLGPAKRLIKQLPVLDQDANVSTRQPGKTRRHGDETVQSDAGKS
jgi:hypothetical protein